MSLEKRKLHHRKGLRHQQVPEYMNQHCHNQWWDLDYTIYTGDRSINAVAPVRVGRTVRLNPVALMYAVKAEMLIDYTFAGPPDSFDVFITDCSGTIHFRVDSVATYGVVTQDISEWMGTILKELCEVGLQTSIKVSNAAVPVIIHSINLRYTMYKNDSFGGYERPTDQFLIFDSKIDRDYIQLQAKLSEGFTYLSGLEMT